MDHDEHLRRLLGKVAHELNNPLSIVLGQATLLCQALADDSLRSRAIKIARAAERCADIVRTLLALGGLHPPRLRATSLNALLADVVRQCARQLRRDQIEVILDLDSELPLARVDPQQIREVLVNLVANAHQAMAGARGARRLSLRTRHDESRERLRLEIEDTGHGIAPRDLARIFDPFFTTAALGQQAGLGLTLCRGIVERHGGTIDVASRVGHGTVFTVDLPRQPSAGATPWDVVPASASTER